MNKSSFRARIGLLFVPLFLGLCEYSRAATPPNIVIIFADDLGYGDLGSYGHPSIRTPHLDRMAAEGMRFTDFYAASSVCTPSRAALLTGRYALRSGMTSGKRRVLFPNSTGGLPAEELTLAEALKPAGYASAMIGKWHLGRLPEHSPLKHGFDYAFGLPYSNDMDRDPSTPQGMASFADPKIEYWRVPLIENDVVVEKPADQTTLTRRYTEEALSFIRKSKDRPFFLYFAHTFPHIPLFASPDFKGRSARGLYGDTVEELDWSVGQVLETLRREGLAENTLVFFTSDNGPWLMHGEQGGSAGLLREGKGSTWEGGMRVPGIAHWPGHILPGSVTHDLACTMDLYTTALGLAGVVPPSDRVVDGVDLGPLLMGKKTSPRSVFVFYRDDLPFALRKGYFKIHFKTKSAYGKDPVISHEPPLLYHLGVDPGENYDVAGRFPGVVEDLTLEMKTHLAGMIPGKQQLE